MRVSGYIVSLLFAVVASPLAAQINDTYVVPAAGNTAGAFNTRWQTQLSIFNPQSYPLTVSATLVDTAGNSTETILEIPANAVAFTDNAVADLYQRSGTGALLVAVFPEDNPGVPDDVQSRAVLVTSSTYNNSSSGTYGQSIPGLWTGLQDDGITALAHGIRNIAAQGWRTNIGAVNLGSHSATLRISVYDVDGGTVLDNVAFLTLPPQTYAQKTLPVEVNRGTVEFFLDDPSGNAVVFPYTSTIDQLSGDPTYQNPILFAPPSTLFPKGPIATATPGHRLTSAEARLIAKNATKLGKVRLSREGNRYLAKR